MSDSKFRSWEEAVDWLVSQPDQRELVEACYYDMPLVRAAERYFHSTEWQEVLRLAPAPAGGSALDVGAGNGIASYALAKSGWKTTALEPDKSMKVGGGAIRQLAADAGLDITVVEEFGEQLPFADASYDFVHARQVLHHARHLEQFCKELYRILRPGGVLIATREHIISSPAQLEPFLKSHPLHRFYGGENAFTLKQYQRAISGAGFTITKTIAPFDSPINYAPFTQETLKMAIAQKLSTKPGGGLMAKVFCQWIPFSCTMKLLSRFDNRPGRLYSFVAQKSRREK